NRMKVTASIHEWSIPYSTIWLYYLVECGPCMYDLIPYSLLFVSLFFEVFLLVSFLEQRLRRHVPIPAAFPAELPKVAIIAPCFNEAETVGDTLRSLLSLEYPADKLEVLVVDDGSTDDTYDIAREFARDPRVRVFRKSNGGK